MTTDNKTLTALVTGSSRGLGKMISQKFLNDGLNVVGVSRRGATITHELYTHFEVDLSDNSSIERFFLEINRRQLSVDILANSAACLTSQYAMILPVKSAQLMVDTNLMAPFLMARGAARIMRKKKWGRILNISSMAVKLEPNGDSIYAATKAALTSLSNVMAKEFAPMGITSNTIGVTALETDMLHQLPREKVDSAISGLPLPRLATPDDIFNVVDFLISKRSSYITAQTIYLGGIN